MSEIRPEIEANFNLLEDFIKKNNGSQTELCLLGQIKQELKRTIDLCNDLIKHI